MTNQILDDLVAVCAPRRMTVVGDFSARGGITTTVTASYAKKSNELGSQRQLPRSPIRLRRGGVRVPAPLQKAETPRQLDVGSD